MMGKISGITSKFGPGSEYFVRPLPSVIKYFFKGLDLLYTYFLLHELLFQSITK